jgi:hypothetical protein
MRQKSRSSRSVPRRNIAIALAPTTFTALIVLAALTACSGNANVPRQELAGTWVLNEADSQNPDSVIRNSGGRPRVTRGGAGGVIDGGRGGMGGGRGTIDGGLGGRGGEGRGGDGDEGGYGGRGGFPGGARSNGNLVAMRNVMRVLSEERQRIVIRQTQDTVTFTFADRVPIPYAMNGKKNKRELPGLGEVETKAEWKDGLLNVERKLDGGVKIHDEFVHGPGSPRLIVNTTISGLAGHDVVYRTVYDQGGG